MSQIMLTVFFALFDIGSGLNWNCAFCRLYFFEIMEFTLIVCPGIFGTSWCCLILWAGPNWFSTSLSSSKIALVDCTLALFGGKWIHAIHIAHLKPSNIATLFIISLSPASKVWLTCLSCLMCAADGPVSKSKMSKMKSCVNSRCQTACFEMSRKCLCELRPNKATKFQVPMTPWEGRKAFTFLSHCAIFWYHCLSTGPLSDVVFNTKGSG